MPEHESTHDMVLKKPPRTVKKEEAIIERVARLGGVPTGIL
ncbi:MAG: hypothetical protein ACOX0T_05955 [Pelotomaculum sp.]|jgi:hypothetical protein